MAVEVRIIIEPEHPHLRPLMVVKRMESVEQARFFCFEAGKKGFIFAVALTQHYRMRYIPPCRIVDISYLVDEVSHGLIVSPPQEVDWGEQIKEDTCQTS